MTDSFKKLMRDQVQEKVNDFLGLTKLSVPKNGWLRTIRHALGIPAEVLAKRLGCSRTNIIAIENREKKGTVTLETLEQVAKALNCKLVYCIVPLKPLDQILEDQARAVAKQQIEAVNHSMRLEQQGLTVKQFEQQENALAKEILGSPRRLWSDDGI
jgi:predicted DNA-binding mobile mystery protein A